MTTEHEYEYEPLQHCNFIFLLIIKYSMIWNISLSSHSRGTRVGRQGLGGYANINTAGQKRTWSHVILWIKKLSQNNTYFMFVFLAMVAVIWSNTFKKFNLFYYKKKITLVLTTIRYQLLPGWAATGNFTHAWQAIIYDTTILNRPRRNQGMLYKHLCH